MPIISTAKRIKWSTESQFIQFILYGGGIFYLSRNLKLNWANFNKFLTVFSN